MLITNHAFEVQWIRPGCAHSLPSGTYCDRTREEHAFGPSSLPSGPPVRSDYERALERIRELEAELASAKQLGALAEAERVRLVEHAQELEQEVAQARLDRVQANYERENFAAGMRAVQRDRDQALARLNNLDTLAREVSARVEKMLASVDKPPSVA